jgi:hypothetical protein
MLLPLHSLLGVKLDNFCLVVDNARSPTDPVSFRNQRSRSGGDSSSSAKSRWSSLPPCVAERKDITNLQDTSCSSSMVEMLNSSLRSKSGETSGSGVPPPIRVLTRQLSRDRIFKQAGKNPTRSPATKRKEKIKLRISAPLRVPVRSKSPVVTQRKRNNFVKLSISGPPLGAVINKGSPIHIKGETSGNGATTVPVPIRQLSHCRIQKEGKGSPSSPATKKTETAKRSTSCHLRIPVRHVSPSHRNRISVRDETRANTTTSQKTTKIDIKSMTSNTGSRPRRIPIRRRSLMLTHMGSSEWEHNAMSRDLAKLEKLTTGLLIDIALKEADA